jgi:hypothetical protein
MQQTLEIDTRSSIVVRALRIRANFLIGDIPSSFPTESERASMSLSQQRRSEVISLFIQNLSDLPHACASKESSFVHSWEKLSIRS